MMPQPSRLSVLCALPVLLALAGCGGEESADAPGATGDPVPAAPGPDAVVSSGSGSAVQLPLILSRSADRGPNGELGLLDDLPPAENTTRTPVENRHDPSRTDTVVTLAWTGLELEVYRVTSTGKEILRTVRVTGRDYATDDGLSVGVTRDSVRALRGEPTRTEVGTWIYEVYDGPDDPTATMLRVGFERDRVARLRWGFYID